jgi:hypothetical protein
MSLKKIIACFLLLFSTHHLASLEKLHLNIVEDIKIQLEGIGYHTHISLKRMTAIIDLINDLVDKEDVLGSETVEMRFMSLRANLYAELSLVRLGIRNDINDEFEVIKIRRSEIEKNNCEISADQNLNCIRYCESKIDELQKCLIVVENAISEYFN